MLAVDRRACGRPRAEARRDASRCAARFLLLDRRAVRRAGRSWDRRSPVLRVASPLSTSFALANTAAGRAVARPFASVPRRRRAARRCRAGAGVYCRGFAPRGSVARREQRACSDVYCLGPGAAAGVEADSARAEVAAGSGATRAPSSRTRTRSPPARLELECVASIRERSVYSHNRCCSAANDHTARQNTSTAVSIHLRLDRSSSAARRRRVLRRRRRPRIISAEFNPNYPFNVAVTFPRPHPVCAGGPANRVSDERAAIRRRARTTAAGRRLDARVQPDGARARLREVAVVWPLASARLGKRASRRGADGSLESAHLGNFALEQQLASSAPRAQGMAAERLPAEAARLPWAQARESLDCCRVPSPACAGRRVRGRPRGGRAAPPHAPRLVPRAIGGAASPVRTCCVASARVNVPTKRAPRVPGRS